MRVTNLTESLQRRRNELTSPTRPIGRQRVAFFIDLARMSTHSHHIGLESRVQFNVLRKGMNHGEALSDSLARLELHCEKRSDNTALHLVTCLNSTPARQSLAMIKNLTRRTNYPFSIN